MTITSPIASSIASAIAYPLRGNVGNALVLRAFGAGSSGAIQGLVLGAGPMSVVRGTEATVTDFEGLAKMTLANELRFADARRVENIDDTTLAGWDDNGNVVITDNGDGTITAAGYTASGGDSIANSLLGGKSIDARRFVVSYDIKATDPADSGQVVELRLQRLSGGDGAAIVVESEVDVTVTADWQRFMTIGTGVTANIGLKLLITGGIAGGTICSSIDVRRAMIEEVTGQTNQNPSDYIPSGVEYFAYENGNTVASNVVTEAKGADLATDWGALFESLAVNYTDGNDDLSGGAETIDLTASGTGNYTLSVYGTAAVTVAAGTATGTGFAQATEGSDVTFNLSVAGTVTLTLDSGALDTTNGLAQKQIEKSAFFTSWIPTSGSQETRWADDAMPFVSVSGNVDETKGMAVFDLIPSVSSADLPATQAVISLSDATNSLFRLESSSPQIKSFDGTNTASAILAFAAGNRYRFAVRWSANDSEFQVGYRDITGAGSWVWGSAQTFDGAFVTGTNINIFYPVPSAPFVIRDLRIYETDEGIGWIEANY